MKIVGIIVEYNPFHNGHKYHIEKANELTGADYVVAVMSGNFVQRGTPAITDKYTRTKMALLNGVDVVYELPAYYASASAESFAFGAVSILNGLGSIDYLCFGAENDDLALMQTIAEILLKEPPTYKTILKKELAQGISFPLARKKALMPLLTDYEDNRVETLLKSSNSILGIEYIKALLKLNSSIVPIVLKRKGSGYNEEALPEDSTLSSATALRKNYEEYKSLNNYHLYVPDNVKQLLSEAEGHVFPMELDDFSQFLYYKLRTSTYEELITYLDVSDDLARRIFRLRLEFVTISTFCERLKTKQFTLTRIQRALLHILLNIKVNNQNPIYARLLGCRKTATKIISKDNASIQIITKPADYKEMLTHDILCSDLYNYAVYKKFHTAIPNDYRHPLIII